jgi:GT2 family glycosyltransferase
MGEKIGVGIVTCNRPDFLNLLLDSIDGCECGELVVLSDGDPLDTSDKYHVINNETNLGVGKSKNKLMQYLLDRGCDYIFIIEDDMIILDKTVFSKYIEAYKKSGIHHFNYGPGSPFNRKQTIKNFDLHNRHLLDQQSEPHPRLIIDYGDDVKVSLFNHTVAMFSFFTRESLLDVGLYDEAYYNAWEHVDHTYMLIKAGYHPPFWWFADIFDSHKYLTEAPGAIDDSSIANDSEQWHKNVNGGREIYLKKHGHYPNQPPVTTKEQVMMELKTIKHRNNVEN